MDQLSEAKSSKGFYNYESNSDPAILWFRSQGMPFHSPPTPHLSNLLKAHMIQAANRPILRFSTLKTYSTPRYVSSNGNDSSDEEISEDNSDSEDLDAPPADSGGSEDGRCGPEAFLRAAGAKSFPADTLLGDLGGFNAQSQALREALSDEAPPSVRDARPAAVVLASTPPPTTKKASDDHKYPKFILK